MICDKCKGQIVLHAFSYDNCDICMKEIITAHIPCNKVCVECSEKHCVCERCANKID
jgi:hypothetical protein